MDYNNQNQPYNPQNPYNTYPPYPASDKRSKNMEIAALVCGIIAIAGCAVFYVSIVCGALSIIFALLSRGGERTCGTKAGIGLGCGVSGLLLCTAVYGMSFAMLFAAYGSPGNFYHTFQKYEEEADGNTQEAYDKMYDDVYRHLYDFMTPKNMSE